MLQMIAGDSPVASSHATHLNVRESLSKPITLYLNLGGGFEPVPALSPGGVTAFLANRLRIALRVAEKREIRNVTGKECSANDALVSEMLAMRSAWLNGVGRQSMRCQGSHRKCHVWPSSHVVGRPSSEQGRRSRGVASIDWPASKHARTATSDRTSGPRALKLGSARGIEDSSRDSRGAFTAATYARLSGICGWLAGWLPAAGNRQKCAHLEVPAVVESTLLYPVER